MTDNESMEMLECLYKWRAIEYISEKNNAIKSLVEIINKSWLEVKERLENNAE